MEEAKCPVCASRKFFVKDEEDEFEVHDFEIVGGEVVFQESGDPAEAPRLEDGTEAYCGRCSWHGAMERLTKGQ
ncbi:MAG: hypothetical protein MUF52_09765 [Syntrophobacteraceae bacterium]|jgi:hypothetical protein|nr:hypothetical protein [Syntrophobacteraceae bacterium]